MLDFAVNLTIMAAILLWVLATTMLARTGLEMAQDALHRRAKRRRHRGTNADGWPV